MRRRSRLDERIAQFLGGSKFRIVATGPKNQGWVNGL